MSLQNTNQGSQDGHESFRGTSPATANSILSRCRETSRNSKTSIEAPKSIHTTKVDCTQHHRYAFDLHGDERLGTISTSEGRTASSGSSDTVSGSESLFKSRLAEAGFVTSLGLTQLLAEYLISGFGLLLPTISERWKNSSISPTWTVAILSLVMSSLMLPLARISDIYGGCPCFFAGLIWLSISTAAAGSATGEVLLNICRAMQGVALSALMPATFALVGRAYPAGRRRNVVIGIYAAMAPLGFFCGILVSGVALHFHQAGWYFWTSSVCAAFAAGLAYTTAPPVLWMGCQETLAMDWLGTVFITSGLVLISYACAASSYTSAGWKSVTIAGPLLAGVASLIISVYIEKHLAKFPLFPTDFFARTNVKPMLMAVFLFFSCFGTFLFYVVFYMKDVMHASSLEVVVYFIPLAAGGIIVSIVSGAVVDRIPLQAILLFSGAMWILSPLSMAVAPAAIGYSSCLFVSMACTSLGVDLTYTVASVFLSSVQPPKYQALAGAMNSVILNLAIALSVSLGSIISAGTSDQGPDLSFKAVFWFAVGLAGTGFLTVLFFVGSQTTGPSYSCDTCHGGLTTNTGR